MKRLTSTVFGRVALLGLDRQSCPDVFHGGQEGPRRGEVSGIPLADGTEQGRPGGVIQPGDAMPDVQPRSSRGGYDNGAKRPLIIAHRGASGLMPEHTLEAYRLGLDLGADAVETDVVLTRDGELVCRHDCELSLTTDIASRPEFAARKTIKRIDGETAAGWFVEDFTLAEIRTLRSCERFDFRDHSFDGKFAVVTLAELLDFIASAKTRGGHPAGLIIEIKHAAYFDSLGMSMENAICKALRDRVPAKAESDQEGVESFVAQASRLCPPAEKHSRDGRATDDSRFPIWIECFEIDVLRRLRQRISTPIIQLLDAATMQPADIAAAGGSMTFGDMTTPAGLAQIATYATGIGAWKELVIPMLSLGGVTGKPRRQAYAPPTSLVSDAHAIGLGVHAWTFRNEPQFLAADNENDPLREYRRFADLKLDGFITDFPEHATLALKGIRRSSEAFAIGDLLADQ